MKRRQLVELNDLPWWPSLFRTHLTDYLKTVVDKLEPFSPRLDLLVTALKQSGGRRMVDLCSGSGGPWQHLLPQLEKELGEPLQVVLSDRYPAPLEEQQALAETGLDYWPAPVDARAMPAELDGVRTIFDALHHFPPAEAQAILQDAVDHRQPILAYEILHRGLGDLIFMAFSLLLILLLTPFIKPFSLSRLFFTYLLPVTPLAILYDTLVSTLRCYSPQELLEMTGKLDGDDYQWQAGRYRVRGTPVTYLAGWPVRIADGETAGE